MAIRNLVPSRNTAASLAVATVLGLSGLIPAFAFADDITFSSVQGGRYLKYVDDATFFLCLADGSTINTFSPPSGVVSADSQFSVSGTFSDAYTTTVYGCGGPDWGGIPFQKYQHIGVSEQILWSGIPSSGLLGSGSALAGASILTGFVGTAVDSVWPLVLLALSIPLAFWIVIKIMGIFPGGSGRNRDIDADLGREEAYLKRLKDITNT